MGNDTEKGAMAGAETTIGAKVREKFLQTAAGTKKPHEVRYLKKRPLSILATARKYKKTDARERRKFLIMWVCKKNFG